MTTKKPLILILAIFLLALPMAFAAGELLGSCDFSTTCNSAGLIKIFNNLSTSYIIENLGNGTLQKVGDATGGVWFNITKTLGTSVNDDTSCLEMDYKFTRISSSGSEQGPIFYSDDGITSSAAGWVMHSAVTSATYRDNLPELWTDQYVGTQTFIPGAEINKDFKRFRFQYNNTIERIIVFNETTRDSGTYKAVGNHTDGGGTGNTLQIFIGDTRGAGGNADYDLEVNELKLYNSSCDRITVSDTTLPTFTTTSNNNTNPKINNIIQLGVKATDETSLSMVTLAWNGSNINGIWTNISNSSVQADPTLTFNFTVNKSIVLPRETVIGYMFCANDTSNNKACSPVSTFIVANSPPTFNSVVGGAKSQPNASTVLYLDLDQRNATHYLDLSGNKNDGRNYDTNRSYGQNGWGAVFDGVDDYINLTNIIKFETVEMWINTTDGWQYLVNSSGVTYKNNIQQNIRIPFNNRTGNIVIGQYDNEEFYIGKIDEVRVWNISLSANEISNIYSKNKGTGNITTTDDLSASPNNFTDADNDVPYTAVDWYKNGILNATTGKPDDNQTALFMPFDARNTTGITEDYSVMNNDGNILGALFTNDSAMGLGALQFDGVDDYVQINNEMIGENQGTITAWINTRNLVNQHFVIHTGKASMDGFGSEPEFYIWTNAANLGFHYSDGNPSLDISINTAITTDRWYYVAAVWNNGNAELFLDGVSAGTDTYTSPINKTDWDNITHIGGASPAGVKRYWNGTIDEVRVYNRSLSESEIQQHYQASKLKGLILNNSETKKNEKWNATITLYDSAPSATSSINFSFDAIGNIIPNSTNFVNISGLNYNQNQSINWSSSFDPDATDGIDTLNYIVYWDLDSTPASLLQNNTKLGFSTNWTTDSTYFYQIKVMDSESESALSPLFNITLDTPPQPPSGINWLTTGGFTSGTRLYNEILDYVNATCLSDTGLQSCNLTITSPSGSKAVNNASMTLISNNIYSYSTNVVLNEAGTWTLTVDANDNASISSASTTITVETQNLTTQNNWYGFTTEGILSESDIDSLVPFDYTLFEFTLNASRFQQDWKQIINSTNYSNSKSVRVGLNILLDFNYSVNAEKQGFYNNITANFSMLNLDPTEDTIAYLSLQLNNASEYSDGDKYGVLNNASANITKTTNNKFVVYAKNYATPDLDESYIQNTTLKYINVNNHFDWINTERSLMRNTSSLNRIYNVNGTLKDDIKTFKINIMDVLRGTPKPTTTVGNQSVGELINGDFIVFNTFNSNKQFYLNFSNVSNVLGKDIWDYTNKIYIHSNTNGTGNINVSTYSATMIMPDNYDHIQGSWKLYKASTTGQLAFNYTDDTNDGNFALDGDADEFKIELFDPHYNINSFITYYGWFNASYITNFSNYRIVIFDDENLHELQPRMNISQNTDFYCYISVADYANTGAWQSGKQTEVNNCINLNPESLKVQIFLDGLDTGVGGVNFSNQFKTLADYVKITKNRKVGLNTYTAYQDFCSYSAPDGFCMKESCVMRWNGSDASNPTAYDWENWDLELNKSRWYQSHNVDVLCQSFSNRTTDTFEMKNATQVQDIYFASLVLGYDDFYASQPDFNYAHTEYFYDAGTDLAQDFSTDDNQTYYRRYSNGIVYFNTSSKYGWIDDGRETDVLLGFRLYDNSDGAGDEERDFVFRVNNVTNDDLNQYTIKATDITAGVWTWHYVKINETHKSPSGNYKIEGSTTNGGQVADGIYIGWENKNATGRHSWYSDGAGDPVWTIYPNDQNWEVSLIVNETKKSSVDTFTTQINQTTTTADGKTNLTLSSTNDFDIEVWSEGVTVTSFINLSYWTGSNFARVYPINTSTCNSNNPTWNSTTINSEAHKSCIETIDANTFVRIATPHLSAQTYQIDNNNPPVVTIIKPVLNTLYNQQPLDINYTITDADGDAITQINIYINNTLNQTITGNSNTTLNASDGKYNISVSAFDGLNWGNNATISSFKIDTVNPSISNLILNSTANNSNFNVTVTASDTNLYGFNCTTYNGNTNSHSITFSEEYTNIASTEQNIKLEYNTSWGDGEKLTVCQASDDHTAKKWQKPNIEIPDTSWLDKLLGKKPKEIIFKKGTSLKEDISIKSNDEADEIVAYEQDDRVSILFDFSGSSKSKLKKEGNKYIYNFSLETLSKYTYRQNSKHNAHFVLGSGMGESWVDYNLKDAPDVEYMVQNNEIIIKTKETKLNFSSIGGVNIAEANTTVILDANAPTLNSFNLTGKLNNTFYKDTNISLTINTTDLFLSNISIYKNTTKNITTLAYNGSNLIVINLTKDGNYSLFAGAKDKAGNEINFTYFYNLVIDTTLPIGVNATNRTKTNSKTFYTNTDANISVFLGDIYLSAGNFSQNCTMSNRSWINASIIINGNNTYNNILGSANFTAGQVCGWKYYAYDLAGNELDPTYTFEVNAIPSTTPTSSFPAVPGGGGGSITIPSSTIQQIQQQQESYFINSTCSIQVIPKTVVLNKDYTKDVVQIKYLNAENIDFNNKFTTVGNLPSAVPYIEKQQSSVKLFEKLNVTLSLKEIPKENSFVNLLLNFTKCGSYNLPITVEGNKDNENNEDVSLFNGIINYTNNILQTFKEFFKDIFINIGDIIEEFI